ncbi:MAG: LAGLIDADG family homing endonuclease [Patescibacteria group bacterium]
MEVKFLKYPKKSHRKLIKVPQESTRLAELMGIEFGDGGIGNSWQMVVTLNAEKDAEYALYVEKIMYNLFGVKIRFRKRGKRTLQIISSSTSLVDFLVKKGAARGNKVKQNFDIPSWVRKNKNYEKAFVRGLVDTDGGLYVHRHVIKGINYRNIGFCFTSFSRNLLYSVSDIFRKFGVEPHIAARGSRICLYSESAIKKYLRIFGSNNPRVINLYKNWRDARAA